jgi:D-3-phosphoglycerate dehydrogenase
MSGPIRVGLTAGFKPDIGPCFMAPEALAMLDEASIAYEFFPHVGDELAPASIAGYDAILLLGERVTARSFSGLSHLVAIGRWGVGYDALDLDACTAADVCVFITPLGVRRPMAQAIVTMLLALATRLREKDRLVREGGWSRKAAFMGERIAGRTLGSLGLGGIATEMFRLAAPLGMRHIACDPYRDPAYAAALGVELVGKERLLGESDFLCINVPLRDETRGSIGAAELAAMKPSSYLINTARGGIVDEVALAAALRGGRLCGAGLDVFEQEPLPLDSPLLALDNVWLAPHALGWTDELVSNLSAEDAAGLIRLAKGDLPEAIVNTDVLARPGFQRKLQQLRERATA